MNKHYFTYLLIRVLTFPVRFLSYKAIHFLGKILGLIAYFLMQEHRKIALSNLACAKNLHLNNKQIIKYAKKSFENLAITCLEYAKFDQEKDFSKIIQCTHHEYAYTQYAQGKGLIFFCAHLSNWETLFLDGNLNMNGIAIGKPIKNPYLYQWIVNIRQKTKGLIVSPKNALKESLKALRKGKFVGILADQGMPESSYSFPFFGRKAFTSTAPALLAYKTNSPIIVATTKRKNGKYEITYSDPILPNLNLSLEHEITRMMNQSLSILEQKIKESPGEWLWQHNRWKQQTPQIVYKPYRHDCILIILDQKLDDSCFSIFRTIYQREYLTIMLPKSIDATSYALADEICHFTHEKEMFRDDYRFKVVFNFTKSKKIEKFYLKKSAITAISFKDFFRIKQLEQKKLIVKTLCRPNTFDKINAS